ncbi:MAG: type IV secretion system DNA-binding domain-containing protein [Candidatus Methanomethyliaceae archaeon]
MKLSLFKRGGTSGKGDGRGGETNSTGGGGGETTGGAPIQVEPARWEPPRLLRPHDLPEGYAKKIGADPKSFFIIGATSPNSFITLSRNDRVHMMVLGEPGMGKSTFMLLQIVQHIRNNEGFCVIDPHGDLAMKVLSVIPKEKWDRVVYIDPTTAAKYNSVVKISLLECNDPSKKGLVAMGFVDSIKKMYEEFWGPRLERILLNAVYAAMEQSEQKLSDLYDIIMDREKRDRMLANVRDDMVIKYWAEEFPLLKDDAPTAVTNKICRLIQEKIVAPMFDCSHSSVDIGGAMNNGLFMIVNLSEGRLTSDVANFLGALILNKIYQEGMAREELPEEERKPFFIYVDEAHRFLTTSIRDTLQSLRKYKIYVTLAAQYLSQFDKQGGRDRTLSEAIPHLCDAFTIFSVGHETALEIEPILKSIDRYTTAETLMTLKRHQALFLIRKGGRRYMKKGWCVDLSEFKYSEPEEVIKHSLAIYGKEVDLNKYAQTFEATPIPEMEPLPFMILSYMFYKRECRPVPSSEIEAEMRRYGFLERETSQALSSLLYERLLEVQIVRPEGKKGRDGAQKIKRPAKYYMMTEYAKSKFKDVPTGQRGGGDEHTVILGRYVAEQRQNGFFCIVDKGNDPARSLPDVIVFPPQYMPNGKIHPRVWDYARKFAVEIEVDPYHHRDRVVENWEKCLKYGLPVNFITTSHQNKELIISLLSGKGKLVQNLLKDYAPGNIQVDRVTVSGEIIRSYEEESIENGCKKTEVEELIQEMAAKKMGPREKFALLTSRGWEPYVHVSGSGTKEVHARKGELTLYIGRYDDLKDELEKAAVNVNGKGDDKRVGKERDAEGEEEGEVGVLTSQSELEQGQGQRQEQGQGQWQMQMRKQVQEKEQGKEKEREWEREKGQEPTTKREQPAYMKAATLQEEPTAPAKSEGPVPVPGSAPEPAKQGQAPVPKPAHAPDSTATSPSASGEELPPEKLAGEGPPASEQTPPEVGQVSRRAESYVEELVRELKRLRQEVDALRTEIEAMKKMQKQEPRVVVGGEDEERDGEEEDSKEDEAEGELAGGKRGEPSRGNLGGGLKEEEKGAGGGAQASERATAPPDAAGEEGEALRPDLKLDPEKKALVDKYLAEGYRIRIKEVKGIRYLTARKKSGGRRLEKLIARIDMLPEGTPDPKRGR